MAVRVADFEIAGTWDGGPLTANEFARVELTLDAAARKVTLAIEAAYFADPKPDAPAGELDGLWNFEVVELFLLGADRRYLELEFGPHDHFLALRFRDQRLPDARPVGPVSFVVDACDPGPSGGAAGSWRGRATFDWAELPDGLFAANLYALHGASADRRNDRDAAQYASREGKSDVRRYLAMHPVPGSGPDFHRLDYFRPIEFR